MLHRKLWLAGAVGAVCLAISAGIAQDQVPASARSQGAARPEGGVTVIPRSAAPVSNEQLQEFAPELRRYQRSQPAASAQPSPKPAQSRSVPTAKIPAVKNYHKELFGTEPPLPVVVRRYLSPASQPQGQSAAASPERPLTPARSAQPTAAPPRQNPSLSRIQQASHKEAPLTLNPAQRVKPASPGNVAQISETPSQRVVPADYTASDSRQPIQQVTVQQAASPLAADLDRALAAPPQSAPRGITEISHTLHPAPVHQPVEGATMKRHFVTNVSNGSPKIETMWRKKSDINVGQECHLQLIVKNTGDAKAALVEIAAEFPETVQLVSASPKPFADGTWKIPEMVAGKEHRIDVTLIPLRRGEIAANANVRYTSAATSVFSVEEPMLALAVKGPEKVALGEPASHLVTISNPGTGVAHDVSVMVSVPEGLQHASRRNRLMMDLGSLSPGEKRNVRLSLTAIGGGDQSIVVDAKGAGKLAKQAKSLVQVLAPELAIAVKGPGLRYLGRDARYSVSVSNHGAATTDNVRAMYAVPEGFEFQSASRGVKYDEKTRIVSWFVGSVKSKESVDLSLKLKPAQIGRFAHAARVVSEHGDIAEAQSEPRLEGSASLVLKVADLDDPVEIGRETAYEISVHNDGSKEAQNVGLSIELPVGVKLVDVKGPSAHSAQPGGLVIFKPLAIIPPGKTATWRVFIQGTEEGNQRLRARLTSDSIQEPLTIEELTRFYAE